MHWPDFSALDYTFEIDVMFTFTTLGIENLLKRAIYCL